MRNHKKFAVFLSLALILSLIIPSFTNICETRDQVQAATMKLNISSKKLNIGSNVKLKVKNLPSYYKVSWSSKNKTVATVSSSGVVKAKGAGVTQIKATVKYGNTIKKTLTCKIEVNYPPLRRTLNVTEQYLGKDKTFNLSVMDADSFDKITFVSNNNSIATVDYTGVITGHAIGTATITVLVNSADGKQSCTLSCIVHVISNVQSRELKDTLISVEQYKECPLEVLNAKSTDYITYTSLDENIARVEQTGGSITTITGVNVGETYITVRIKKEGNEVEEKSCYVTVKAYDKTRSISVPSIIDKDSSYPISITGLTALDRVTYQISDKKVATVTTSGILKGVGEGYAVLTVTITFPTGESVTKQQMIHCIVFDNAD